MPDDTDARLSGSDDDLTLGEVIRRRRRALGLNQTQVGEIVGVDQSTIARWERGDRISPERLPKAAAWLGLPAEVVVRMNFQQIRFQPSNPRNDRLDSLVLTEWLAQSLVNSDLSAETREAALAALAAATDFLRRDEDEVIVSFSFTHLDDLSEHLAAAELLGLGVTVRNDLLPLDDGELLLRWTLELTQAPPTTDI